MLRAFISAFKIPDLRRKLLFTIAIMALYRVGSWIPVPGVDVDLIEGARAFGGGNQIATIVNVFSGGALAQMAVFALGIMPYITASIIMQLLAVVIPRLEQLQKEGEQGRQQITQYSRYTTIALAVLQSTALITLARNGTLFQNEGGGIDVMPGVGTPGVLLAILTLTAGTGFIMWLGELITQRGVGNGMSLIIYVAILSSFPSLMVLTASADVIQLIPVGPSWIDEIGVVVLLGILLTLVITFMEQGQRRIPVQYARRQVGRRSYGGQSTYIPLKVNQGGVIPVIFSASLMYVPQLVAQLSGSQWLTELSQNQLGDPGHPLYIAVFAVLTIFFVYFYTAIIFDPVDVADNMKQYGGFIPGIRPGRQTAEYLDGVITRLTLPGSLYLTAIAALPFVMLAQWDLQFPLGGIEILIMVGVALQTMQQVESQLMQRDYEGFLTY